MEVFPRTSIAQLPLVQPSQTSTTIPSINLTKPNSKVDIIKACEDFGFFKVTHHGISMELIGKLEEAAVNFFKMPLQEKEKASSPNPLGYGSVRVGKSGDMNWVEYLLMSCESVDKVGKDIPESFHVNKECLRSAIREYIQSVRNLACKVLELLGEGLDIKPKNFLSNLIMDSESEDILRINHNPPCPEIENLNGLDLVGFGEHTDIQIITVLRSNNVQGFQILLKDGNWVPVPPDENNFFILVDDSLQVMTNGRFKSVKHRVLANPSRSRFSMLYFAAPSPNQKISPPQSLMDEGEKRKYTDFTYGEYKKAAYQTRLAENRLSKFERQKE